MYMKKIIGILLLGVLILFVSCQAVFTYSPVTFLQRDISTRPAAEQISRARDVLGSGDVEQMEEAYAIVEALLETSDDPELSLLAADLAFGASGMTEVFTSALQDLDTITEGSSEELEEVLEDLDTELIAEGADHIQTAIDAGAEVSDTQYVIAGAALLTTAVELAGGFDEVGALTEGDPGFEEFQDAEAYFTAGGATDLLDMFEL
jgi:hypothetical protein